MLRGIDISDNNGTVNMAKVKAAGYDFTMIKASQGTTFKAKTFDANVSNAYAAGIAVGTYHWLTARTVAEAVAEAKYFIACMTPLKSKIYLWAAVDVEDKVRLSGLTKAQLTDIVVAFCNTVKNAGFRPMVYSNHPWFSTRMDYSRLGAYDIWLARWRSDKTKPAGYERAAIWQHDVLGSAEDVKKGWAQRVGSVNGVPGAIDVNYGYFDLAQYVFAPVVDPPAATPAPVTAIKKGDKVKVINTTASGGAKRGKTYKGSTFVVYYDTYEVISISGDRAVIGINGKITADINVKDLKKI